MDETKLSILEKTGSADVQDLVRQVRDWRKLGEAVRVAACGPGHSMGSRLDELAAIVQRLADAKSEIQRLRAQPAIRQGCTGHLVHDEFTSCPVHDR